MTTATIESVSASAESVKGEAGPSAQKTALRAMALAAQIRCHAMADRASRASEDSAGGPGEAVRYAVIAGRAAVAAFRLAE